MLMEEAYCVQTLQIQPCSYKKYPGISTEHEEKILVTENSNKDMQIGQFSLSA